MPNAVPKVVIVGSGFAGLNAAKALRNADVEITIIDHLDIERDSTIAGFRVLVRARRSTDDGTDSPVVLDWTPVALVRRGDNTEEKA